MRTATCRVARSILLLACMQIGLTFHEQAAANQHPARMTWVVAAVGEVPRDVPRSDDCRKTPDEAEAALAAAVHRKEAGVEPKPGERQRLANGFSRLRPAYFERQRQLERNVVTAQRCLNSAASSPE